MARRNGPASRLEEAVVDGSLQETRLFFNRSDALNRVQPTLFPAFLPSVDD
jgi:hypothetical protein